MKHTLVRIAASAIGMAAPTLRSIGVRSFWAPCRTRTTSEPFDLRAPRAHYSFSQYAITLSPHVRLIDCNGRLLPEPRGEDVATFIHEYIHYLHNYSTLAGLTHLVMHHEIGLHLSTCPDPTVTSHFESVGKLASEPGAQALGVTLGRLLGLDGDAELPVYGATSYRFVTGDERFDSHGKLVDLRLEVRDLARAWHSTRITLGLRAIEESIAYEIQCIVSRNIAAPDPDPPSYPYLALRKLRDAYCPAARMQVVLRLAVLSLNVPNMAEYLIRGLRSLRERVNHRRFVREEAARVAKVLAAAPHDALGQALGMMFTGRGLLEDAGQHASTLVAQLMQLRLRSMFFDIEAAEDKSGASLERLMSTLLPCEVVQMFADGSSAIYTWGSPAANPDRLVYARRAMQSHIHMTNRHLTANGLLSSARAAEAGERNCCPFFGSCNLALRHNDPDTCRTRPWVRSARSSGAKTCWYGHGAAMTFATGPRPV